MHDTAQVHIPVAHLMSERNIDGDNGPGRTKDSRFGPHDNKPKEEPKRHMNLMITSPNSCAFVHAQTEGLMRDNSFLPPINPII